MDKPQSPDATSAPNSAVAPGTNPAAVAPTGPPPVRRPGHRGADMRDTVAEMAERAHLISQEAGTKVAAAMKDVISAGAGIAGFAIESARDLVAYMVKRGQMTPEEADKLIREAEAAHDKRPASEKERPTASKVAADRAAVVKAETAARNAAAAAAMPPFRPAMRPVVPPAATPEPVIAKAAAKEPAKAAKAPAKPVAKPAAKAPAKVAAKLPVKAAKPAAATKAPAKPTKPVAKAPVKSAKPVAKPAAKKSGKR